MVKELWPSIFDQLCDYHDPLFQQTDYNGNWSGLAQDIAKKIFEDDFRGINFCTADKKENAVTAAK